MTPKELKTWREKHGLTQQELADLLGIHWVTVNRWENDSRKIPPFLHLALKSIEHNRRGKPPTG